MSKAILSSIDGRWHEVDDATAAASDQTKIADIIETEQPAYDPNVELSSSVESNLDGQPQRTWHQRSLSAAELRRYISRLEFLNKLGTTVYGMLCQAALQNPQIFGLMHRLSCAVFIESDDPEINAGVDLLISAGFPIDKQALFSGWRKTPPLDINPEAQQSQSL